MQKIDDQFELSDIASSLLDELATGLYDPHEVIREYVQNAVDSHRLWEVKYGMEPEGPVQIELRDDGSLTIMDYGIGMNKEEILNVKSIGVSRKEENEATQTGYKGVGIWAGLSSFESIRIESSKKGNGKKFVLEIDFREITESIGDGNMAEVLNPNYSTYFSEEDTDRHYTDVNLIRPTKNSSFFQDEEKVVEAVRKNCPCRLDSSTFGWYDKISEWYEDNGFEFFEILVNGKEVKRSYPSNIRKPIFEQITVDDKVVAKLWRAFTDSVGSINTTGNQLSGYRLFSKGFIVGGNNPYAEENINGLPSISSEPYVNWQVGEIFIVDDDISPKLQRDELESTTKSNSFKRKLRELYDKTYWRGRVISHIIKIEDKQNRLDKLISEYKNGKQSDEVRQEINNLYESMLEDRNDWKDHEGKSLAKSKVRIKAVREEHIKKKRRKLIKEAENVLGQSSNGDTSDSSDADQGNGSSPESSGTDNGEDSASADNLDDSPASSGDEDSSSKSNGENINDRPSDGQSPSRSPESNGHDDLKMVPLRVVTDRLHEILVEMLGEERAEKITSKVDQYLSSI